MYYADSGFIKNGYFSGNNLVSMTFGEKIIHYFQQLEFNVALPSGVEAMNPYLLPTTMEAVEKFYNKYYSDDRTRTFIVGINPGRFGSGVTGIAFTDTVRLENDCQISHSIPPTTELSSEYIYKVVKSMGGPEAFFSKIYLTAASPIGFTKDGKNYNYYDSPQMLKAMLPFIEEQLKIQLEMGANRKAAFSLGSGKNYKYLVEVNEKLGKPFKKVLPLNHPRFVMQYRRKSMDQEIQNFIEAVMNEQ